jgi:N-acetylglucosaminyldiphosphoundecaprenol N-acetyl-beta-D-mannosaminyltransferase
MLTLNEAAGCLLRPSGPRAVHLCNAYTLSLAFRQSTFASTLNTGTMNLPDGMPLIWIARMLGLTHMNSRVYGPDLMEATLKGGVASKTRHYLYGSTPEVLAQLRQKISLRWPNAEIVGGESPPFGPISDQELAGSVEKMTALEANIVWVGMGTPKQDDLVERFARCGAQTFVAVGAAFDFIAGTKRQAPTWVQNSGLEWLYRFASEPRRLFKRYVVGNSQFIISLVLQRPRLVEPTSST